MSRSINAVLSTLEIESVNSGACGTTWIDNPAGEKLPSTNPSTGETIASVTMAGPADYDRIVSEATGTFRKWRLVPAPERGRIVREIGDELRAHKQDLGRLVTLESGKILSEGLGEVQEMIDLADFATGLSRQLYGLTMPSERPAHRMYEQWLPLGPAGVITAFNFPVAVWSWNTLIATVCGDCVIWKPSEETPLTSIAVHRICRRVLERNGWPGVFNLCIGRGPNIGRLMAADRRLPLISFTGSTPTGREIATTVAQRLGRTILELGGNNAVIVMNDADLKLAVPAIVFGAAGTAGQRCTTTRRLFLQRGIAADVRASLIAAYQQIRIGDPLDDRTLMGPLINERAVENMMRAIRFIQEQGGKVLHGGRRLQGCFVEPTLVDANPDMQIVQQEIFAPILYLMEFEDLDDAIALHNAAPQGLSSAIFTNNLVSAEIFLSPRGSDCGIANVNIGTSGAEIGGAFGGEKDTGGGRESGSDSWKAYMRRQTVTINSSSALRLAQGVKFDL